MGEQKKSRVESSGTVPAFNKASKARLIRVGIDDGVGPEIEALNATKAGQQLMLAIVHRRRAQAEWLAMVERQEVVDEIKGDLTEAAKEEVMRIDQRIHDLQLQCRVGWPEGGESIGPQVCGKIFMQLHWRRHRLIGLTCRRFHDIIREESRVVRSPDVIVAEDDPDPSMSNLCVPSSIPCFETIKEAFEAAPEGGLIVINTQFWHGELVELESSKGVTLVAASAGINLAGGCRIVNSKAAEEEGDKEECALFGFTVGDRHGVMKDTKNKSGTVYIKDASPLLVDCQICDMEKSPSRLNAESSGVLIEGRNSRPTLINCSISGPVVVRGADPTVTRCTISDGRGSGLFVQDGGRGSYHGCDIHNHRLACVAIESGSMPFLTACRIHSSWNDVGVFVHKGGRGIITECDIYDNKLGGICVQDKGHPTVVGCVIRDHKQSGVFVSRDGGGTFKRCDMFGNQVSNFARQDGADYEMVDCDVAQVREDKRGVKQWLKSLKTTLDDCEDGTNVAHLYTVASESKPWECPHCTLMNLSDAECCEACDWPCDLCS